MELKIPSSGAVNIIVKQVSGQSPFRETPARQCSDYTHNIKEGEVVDGARRHEKRVDVSLFE